MQQDGFKPSSSGFIMYILLLRCKLPLKGLSGRVRAGAGFYLFLKECCFRVTVRVRVRVRVSVNPRTQSNKLLSLIRNGRNLKNFP